MDDLLRTRAKNAEEAGRKGRKKRKKSVSYTASGKVKRGKLPVGVKILIGLLAFLALLALAIYIPPLFYREPPENSYVPIMPDATAIKAYQTYLKDSPEADFDNDGLDNTIEAEYGTDVWNVDTDGDGVSDYAELFITETSPTDATNILVKQIKDDDQRKEMNLGTPYKLDDIIFWPETYQDKAYGAVVKLSQSDQMIAYRFCYYTGWVKFPYDQAYAYGYKDGVHYELKHKEAENAWKIETSDEIRLYTAPLSFVHVLKLPFVGTIYLDDDGFGQLLTKVLPHKGSIVTCHKASTLDEEPEVANDTTATLRQPYMDKSDLSRLGQNMNTLKDLSWLRKVIEKGHCVAVSFYSGNTGEAIGIIYGYTQEGDLLVANENLEPVGKITIIEKAMRMMDKEGEIGFRSWYEWKGLGFDSYTYGDRISFFASTLTEAEGNELPTPMMETEAQTEIETEIEEVQTESMPQSEISVPVNDPAETESETKEEETEKKDEVITFGF